MSRQPKQVEKHCFSEREFKIKTWYNRKGEGGELEMGEQSHTMQPWVTTGFAKDLNHNFLNNRLLECLRR